MKSFESDLKKWMDNSLSHYCLNDCRGSCCKLSPIEIDKRQVHLFKTFRLTGEKVPIKTRDAKGPCLFQDDYPKIWYFKGEQCPNYNPENRQCFVHNQHPMCSLFPLIYPSENSYSLSRACEIHMMFPDKEPLKSLIMLCKKHDITLYGKSRGDMPFDFRSRLK
jgi:Fe-S-cluster containining protein